LKIPTEWIYLGLAVCLVLPLVWYFPQWNVCYVTVSLALVYDNFVLAFGRRIHEYNPHMLFVLSKPRFFMHLAFTPLLCQPLYDVWWISLSLFVLGFGMDSLGKEQKYELVNGEIVRYTLRPQMIPLPAILVTLLVGCFGLWKNSVELVWGSTLMFVLAALPISKFGSLPGQVGEVLLLAACWMHEERGKE
jgi:hypothetical protein